jgi:peptidoglycan/LPS O-acetylase OafA/YrhL
VSSRERYEGLDGLRGLAALVVFAGHVVDMAPPTRVPSLLRNTPLHAAWDGTAAVLLFFVLSGFVLALPFVGAGAQRLTVWPFVVKRICRIYPAYWAALVIALLLQKQLYCNSYMVDASQWFNHFWHTPPTLRELIAHAIMIGPSFDWWRLDPVIWSLVVEMRLSLIYPLVILALGRCRGARAALGLLALAIALAFTVATLRYLPMFVLGGLVARFRGRLFEWARALPGRTALAVTVAALLLFDVRFAFGPTRLPVRASDYVISVGCALLVILVAARSAYDRGLSRGSLAFLGAVSYSFYLIHFPILLTTASRVGASGYALWLAPPIALVVALALAWILYRAVEQSGQALGRRVYALSLRESQALSASTKRHGFSAHSPAYSTPMRGVATMRGVPVRDSIHKGLLRTRSSALCARLMRSARQSSPGPLVPPLSGGSGSSARTNTAAGECSGSQTTLKQFQKP